jgi:DNA-binding beta-propeller fold protein YncE
MITRAVALTLGLCVACYAPAGDSPAAAGTQTGQQTAVGTETGHYVGTTGDARFGHEPYGAPSPLDVAVSPKDGTIYVAQTTQGKVVALTPDFKPTGKEIAAPNVTGVDVAPDGRVAIVTGGADGQLIVVGEDGQETLRVGDKGKALFTDAWGVAWDPAGNLFVFDAGGSRVKVFDPAGKPLFEFGDYTWKRSYESKVQKKRIENEEVKDQLYRPCRGAFLPDGRLIVADYEGPVIDPEANRRGGRYSVWKVDVAKKTAVFEKFTPPGDPYPTVREGDVCVDPVTGHVYYCESDFPLTNFSFVSVADSVDEPFRYRTNFIEVKVLTHPRGIALAKNGDVIVAEADSGRVFAIPKKLFDTPKDTPNPLEWPKVQRIPVCEPTRVVLEYTTVEPALSKIEFAPLKGDWYEFGSPVPEEGKRVVEVPALNNEGRERKPGEPDTFHRVELTDLKPGTRYVYRYLASEKGYPIPLWSEPFIVATAPPPGKTQYIDNEIIVLLFTNLLSPPGDPNIKPEPADPGPMTQEEIEHVKYKLELSRRFYWINSRARINFRFTYVLEPDRYDGEPVRSYAYWPDDDHRKIDAILAKHGVKHAKTAGLFTIYGYRHWDNGEKKWVLSGSGGNTWGACHDGSGVTVINAGGDTCWLHVHEYGHSMSINYSHSGRAFHFNHFHWNWLPTKYGSHYDGNAAICREFSDASYWSNKYGRLVVVDDADNDGIPDDDPQCPLDEKRFGSDPKKVDADGDGLTDLEEMMATEGLASYREAFGMPQLEPVFEPDPQNPDTDGDRLRDGDDPYPLYPWKPEVHFAHVTVDGKIGADEWPKDGFRRLMTDKALTGDVRLAWDFQNLYVGLVQKVKEGEKLPARIFMELDANDDGMTVGADNIEMWLEPQPDGVVNVRTNYNDTIIRMKPIWRRDILPSPRDVQAKWSRQGDEYHLEFALPQTKEAGLDLVRFEPLGFMIQLRPDGAKHEYRLFEPQQHFDVTLH